MHGCLSPYFISLSANETVVISDPRNFKKF